jgi:hypothetical protein
LTVLSECLYDGKKVSGAYTMNAIGPQFTPSAVNPNYFQERYGKANPTEPASSLPLSTSTSPVDLPEPGLENWSLENLESPIDLTFPLTGPEKADFEGNAFNFDPPAPKGSDYERIDTVLEDLGLDAKATKKVLGVVGGILKGEAKVEKSWKF